LRDFDKIKQSLDFKKQGKSPNHYSSSEENESKATKHKNKIIDLDKNRSIEKITPSDIDIENIARDRNILREAKRKVDEERQDVREMNKIILLAQVASVRDRQIKERSQRESNLKQQEEKIDLISEIRRLKNLEFNEKKEKTLKDQQLLGKKIIIDQIKEREKAKENERKDIENDRIKLLKMIKDREKQNLRDQEEQKKGIERIQKEIEDYNHRAIDIKHRKKQEGYEENEKIANYLKEKARKDEVDFQEKKKIKDENELKIQKLREIQGKTQDKQAILHGLRAKRAFEESERQYRDKELMETEFKKKKMDEFLKFNEKQRLDKELKIAEQAKSNEEEFKRIIEKQINQREFEEKKVLDKKSLLSSHNQELLRQIKEKEEVKLMKERELLEEGRKIRQNQDLNKIHLENIKKDKIDLLKGMNVEEKYIVDLEKFKVLDDRKNNDVAFIKKKETKRKNEKTEKEEIKKQANKK